MTKNMTQKSLALGAAAALVVAGFSAPASAAGLADTSFVSLDPSTGTEYTIIADTGKLFSLKANEAPTVSTGNMKFLVTDPSGVIEPTIAGTARSGPTVIQNNQNGEVTVARSNWVDETNKLTIIQNGSTLAAGDKVSFSEDIEASPVYLTANTIATVDSVNGTTSFTLVVPNPTGETTPDVTDNDLTGADATSKVHREARNTTNNTYVVDSGISSAASNETLVLATDGLATRSVTVQAWMDANGNDVIDPDEYASPVRTVTWKTASEMVAVTTMAPVVGDAALAAVITTTPVLNGEQQLVANPLAINAAFTRSLVDDIIYGGASETGTSTSVWNDTDKTFTVSVSLDADTANEALVVAGTIVKDTWGAALFGPTDRTAAMDITSISVATTGVATIVTDIPHNLTSGDKVTVTVNDFYKEELKVASEIAAVVTKTGTSSFTYVMTETTKPAAAVTELIEVHSSGYTVETRVDRVGAETYSAQATVAGVVNGNTVTVTTGVVAAVPGDPTSLRIAHTSNTTATVSWVAPSYNGGVAVSGYSVEYEKGGSWIAATTSGTSAAITGINLESRWSFRVAAINTIGTGSFVVLVNVPPVPYAGPLVTNLAQRSVAVDSDEEVVITGTRLDLVASLSIDGKPCVVVSQSDGQVAIKLPVGLTAGVKDLKILYGSGATVTHQSAFLITAVDSASGSSGSRVNAGSFKGYVALYALNYEGKRLSAKVGNDWVIVESIPASVNNLYRHVEFTGVGYEVQVRIFIDRELEATIPLLTK